VRAEIVVGRVELNGAIDLQCLPDLIGFFDRPEFHRPDTLLRRAESFEKFRVGRPLLCTRRI